MTTLAKKKREEAAPAGSPAWMATFSDLMNLLLCFFVLLYSMSTIDEEKYDAIRASLSNSINFLSGGTFILEETSVLETGIEQLENLQEYTEEGSESDEFSSEFKGYLDELLEEKEEYSAEIHDEISEMFEQEGISSDTVSMTIDSEYNFVKLTINGSILYESGSAEIKEAAMPILSKVGDVLKYYDDYLIEIEGHSDNVPIMTNGRYENNMWLSSARALNAASYLIEKKGLNPATIKSSGRGEYDPVASNDSAEGRQQNRRIEIKIYHALSSY